MNCLKNHKFLFALFFVLLGTFATVAQVELTESQQKDFKAKVQKTALQTQSIASDFVQTKHLSMMENVLVSEGKMVFKSPNLVRWEYVKPIKHIAIFKEGELLVNNDGKRDKMDLNSNKMFRSLNELIVNSIKGDMFDESQFDISYFRIDFGFMTRFVPKDKRLKKFISAFELKFSKDSAEVMEVKLIEPNEDFTLIQFKNRTTNSAIPDSAFEIN